MKNLLLIVGLLLVSLNSFADTYKFKKAVKSVPQKEVQGAIVDSATGKPLVAVTVKVKNSDVGTTTDAKGYFKLKVPSDAVLVISSVGYLTKEVSVQGKETLNVSLSSGSQGLDQLVVVGYQSIKRKDVTGAVSSINADELVMSSAPDIGHMLEGKISGLYIKQNSAQPGGGLDLLVRGGGSINASNAPLIVIDGFPISDVQQPDLTDGWYNGGSFSVLNSLNPNDVKNITVLKDASATAIYGSRAANGVIIITTKKGAEGRPTIRYSGDYSVQPFVNKFPVLPLDEWMNVYNNAQYENWLWENKVKPWGPNTLAETKADPGVAPYKPKYPQKTIDKVGRGTDWIGLVTRAGKTMQHNLSISGGSKAVKYFISGNYYDQKGTVRNSELKRMSFRASTEIKLSNILTLSTLLTASRINNHNSQLGNDQYEKSGVLTAALQQGPDIRARDQSGGYPVNPLVATQPNPLSMLTVTDNGLVEKYRLHPTLTIQPNKHINVKLSGGVERNSSRREEYVPTTTVHGRNNNGIADLGHLNNNHYLVQATANYRNTFADVHSIDILFGTSEEKFINQGSSGKVSNFITDGFLMYNMGAGTGPKTVNSSKGENTIGSYFGRFNYRYQDKYYLTFTFRADGSSVFAPGHKWGYFPSVAVAWDVTQENFFSSLSNAISQFKIRASYGQTGNASIGTDAFASYYSQPAYLVDGQPQPGVFPDKLENPSLKWETTTETNIGLDFAILNGRISGSLDFYNKIISDLLATKQLDSYLPIDQLTANIGETQSTGFGLTINSVNIKTPDFSWKTRLTLSRFYNTWKERAPDWKPSVFESYHDPINAMFYRLADGIQQIGDKVPDAQPELLPGQIKLKDVNSFLRDQNGDRVVDKNGRFILTGQPDGKIDNADYVMVGTGDPSLTGGLVNIFEYKSFRLNIAFNAMFGRKMEDPNFMRFGRNAYDIIQNDLNRMKTVENRWTPTNPSTTQPSTYQDWSVLGNGDFFLQKAWFIRLQDVSLTYFLPHQWFRGVFNRAGIHLAANNLALITPYTGVDPETDAYAAAYPNNSTYTFGINFEF